ncbi:unnamed protein product [Closterium sp. NIES-53]
MGLSRKEQRRQQRQEKQQKRQEWAQQRVGGRKAGSAGANAGRAEGGTGSGKGAGGATGGGQAQAKGEGHGGGKVLAGGAGARGREDQGKGAGGKQGATKEACRVGQSGTSAAGKSGTAAVGGKRKAAEVASGRRIETVGGAVGKGTGTGTREAVRGGKKEKVQAGSKEDKREGKNVGKEGKREGKSGEEREGKRRKITNFERLLEMEENGGMTVREEEEEERMLAKKLNVKGGVLPGSKDGLEGFLGFGGSDEEDGWGGMGGGFGDSEDEEDEEEEGLEGFSEEDYSEDGMVDGEEESEEGEEGEEGEVGEEGEEWEEEEEGEEGEEGEMEEEEAEEEESLGSFEEDGEWSDDGSEEGEEGEEGEELGEEEEGEEWEEEQEEEGGEAAAEGAKRMSALANQKVGEGGKYVPPHLRRAAAAGGAGDEDDAAERQRVIRRLKGLLNRLSESNVDAISADVSTLFQLHKRSLVAALVTDEVITACTNAPRGNEQYAAVFAAFISATASTVGIEFAANFAATLAIRFEALYEADEALGLRNLTMLLAYLYVFKLLAPEVIYSFLARLTDGFRELDVAAMIHLLQSCGLALRADDPVAMKEFILAVQSKAADIRRQAQEAWSEGAGGSGGEKAPVLSKRVEFMLETITDIKNNRAPRNAGRRGGSGTMGGTGGAVMGGGGAAVGGGGGAAGKGKGKGAVSVFAKGGGGAEASDGSTAVSRLQKWLLKRPVEIVQLRSLTWQHLIDPHKLGQWWHTFSSSQPLGSLPATSAALGGSSGSASLAVQLAGNALLDAADVAEAERLMQLAAAQRMNTDARRAVFCVIMSAEDYIDAFEKLLRLGLPGKQDREILRVLVECCMQERHFNKYYSLLAGRLCGHARSHKFSLQYCLWDHYQQLPDMDPRRSLHLAQFAAQIVGTHALSLALLKPVDFADPAAMHARIATHFRLFFLFLLSSFPPATLWSLFSRIAAPTNLGPLRDGILLFFAAHLSPHAPSTRQLLQYIRSEGGSEGGGAAAGVGKGGKEEKVLEERLRLAKKAIANIAGTPYK